MATGILRVKGEQLVDANGDVVVLRGAGKLLFIIKILHIGSRCR